MGLSFLTGEVRVGLRRVSELNSELAEREAFLAGVLASSTDCIKILDLDGRLTFMNEGGMRVMEVSDFNAIEGCAWPDFWQDAGNSDAKAALAAAQSGSASHFIGKADTFMGNSRWWDVSVSPINGPDGSPARILSVSRDTTALMESQEQQRLLNGELGHRLKNLLTLIQSIAMQTFRQADSLESASADFAARISALGKATDVLTATSWHKATLYEIVQAGITSIDGLADRVSFTGPDIELAAQPALALTLALHELSTNACKYGALSNENGTVAIEWKCEPGNDGSSGRFDFSWQEAGGPPVKPPTRRGFGTKLIERSLANYFRGPASLTFDPAGILFTIAVALTAPDDASSDFIA
ncbi:histidine kinase (plasmid) [Sphingomonas paeninsulae]|uniref:histidine kinase n=1 Tax=Sphingomonas paeninsulae TaxID=2319844 RepID=A0A494TFS6_SPHPE|nr:histidine kinase [Sphingomonas paeninsulae]